MTLTREECPEARAFESMGHVELAWPYQHGGAGYLHACREREAPLECIPSKHRVCYFLLTIKLQ